MFYRVFCLSCSAITAYNRLLLQPARRAKQGLREFPMNLKGSVQAGPGVFLAPAGVGERVK
jgi:hypothetical protein